MPDPQMSLLPCKGFLARLCNSLGRVHVSDIDARDRFPDIDLATLGDVVVVLVLDRGDIVAQCLGFTCD